MGYKKDILSNLLYVFEPSHYFYYWKYIKWAFHLVSSVCYRY